MVFMDEGIRGYHPSLHVFGCMTCCPLPRAAGQDATEAFFGLHRHEVLERPQYARLQIGVIEGEEPQIEGGWMPGKLSKVPYAEPSWLADGYYSPYYKEVRALLGRISL